MAFARNRTTGQPDFSRLAAPYRWLEQLVFGSFLDRARNQFIDDVTPGRHILLLGDGDGRFLERCLHELARWRAGNFQIESVDFSPGMVAMARRRVHGHRYRDRVQFSEENVLSAKLSGPYDRVVSHFFVDCLSEPEIQVLAGQIATATSDECLWIISEFAMPRTRVLAWAGRLLIRAMYVFFGLTTGLRVRRIPAYSSCLEAVGFCRKKKHSWLGGLVIAEIWVKDRRALNIASAYLRTE